MKLGGILKNKTVKNAGWIIGGRLVNKALSFVVSVLTARYLGPSNFGLIGYVTAYVTFFASVCNLGINSVIIKNFSDHPEQEGQTLGTTMVLRAVSSILSMAMIVGLVALLNRGDRLVLIVALLSTGGLLFQVFDSLKYWFQSRLQSKYAAIATVVAYIAVSAYKIALLVAGKSVAWFAPSTTVEHLVVAVFLLAAYRKNKGPGFSFSASKAKELLGASSSYIVSGLMVSVYASTDKLMLEQMLGTASVGYYATAVSISSAWTFLLAAVIDSMYPSVIKAHTVSQEMFRKRNRQLYAVVLYTSIGVSCVISLLARPIISLLYGQAYLPAVMPLRIITWYTAFSYLGVARNAWMVCENKQKYLKYLYIAAALGNVLLNWALLPVWGASGAALASLLTQILTIVVLPWLIRPLRPNAQLMIDALLLRDVVRKKKAR